LNRVIFVEQFYYPEGWGGAELPRELTMALTRAGFAVEVICGSDPYTPVVGDPGPDPSSFGVRIRRVPALFHAPIHRAKLLRQAWFYLFLAPLLLFRRRPSLFISQTNPPLAVVLTAVAARFWRRPLLIIAMDIYPEVLVAHGLLGHGSLLGGVVRRLFEWTYRSAHTIVSLGPVMTRRLRDKQIPAAKIVEISNWATGPLDLLRADTNPLREELRLQDGLTLLYSGNLGLGHEFDTLLEGFALALRSQSRLNLVFVGTGKRVEEVRAVVAKLGIAHAVRMIGFLPSERLPESMGLADVCIVTLRPGFEGLIVPSKLFGYIARGLPVLYVGPDSDVDHFIARCRCGVSIRNGDVKAVADAILRLSSDRSLVASLGAAGKDAYVRELSRERAVGKYLDVVHRICGIGSGVE
jgi:glycosyltransferase involved in cell wall biosynthesis